MISYFLKKSNSSVFLKVAAFLFRNRRRIRIYDMEAEEEDLDDDTLGTSGMSSDLNTSG